MLPVAGSDCGDATICSHRRAAASCVPAVLALAASLVAAAPTHADERLFGFLSTTDTMPHGKWEQQDFLTARLGKSRGDYQLYQLQNGVDYGVTDAFQAALYLDSHLVTADGDSPAGRTSGAFVPHDVDPARRYTSAALDGVTLNAKYRLTSPYIESYGLAFALQPTIGPDEVSIEYRAIGQKDFFDDTLIWATNLAFLQDWQHVSSSPVDIYNPTAPGGPGGWTRQSVLEFTTGLSCRFAENWFLGLEFRNVNGFSGALLNQAGYSAFFLGPNLHYGGQDFWATLTILPQLPLAQAYSADQREVLADGRIYGDEHETVEARLSFGIQF
jgi:hypothetical protein